MNALDFSLSALFFKRSNTSKFSGGSSSLRFFVQSVLIGACVLAADASVGSGSVGSPWQRECKGSGSRGAGAGGGGEDSLQLANTGNRPFQHG
jgi:hypothetical protein